MGLAEDCQFGRLVGHVVGTLDGCLHLPLHMIHVWSNAIAIGQVQKGEWM